MQESRVDWIKKGKYVQIRDWESMESEFGVDEDGDIDCYLSFTKEMLYLCGRIITITHDMEITYVIRGCFTVYDEDGQAWILSEDMLKPVFVEEVDN